MEGEQGLLLSDVNTCYNNSNKTIFHFFHVHGVLVLLSDFSNDVPALISEEQDIRRCDQCKAFSGLQIVDVVVVGF